MIQESDSQNPFQTDLNFPVLIHFKIIAKMGKETEIAVKAALLGLDIPQQLEEGNLSKKGSYVTYNVSIHVKSRDRMIQIDQTLRKVPGVQMVL